MKFLVAVVCSIFVAETVSANAHSGIGSMMMSFQGHQMFSNPFKNKESELDKMLETCLSKLNGLVDIVIDVDSGRAEKRNNAFLTPMFGRSTFGSFDIANFVNRLTEVIPQDNLFAVIVDGANENQVRYYINNPVDPNEEPTTTQAPITGFTQSGSMSHYWFVQHHSFETSKPVLRDFVINALQNRSMNIDIEFPRTRNQLPSFTIVVTDSSQGSSLSSLAGNGASLILDIGGNAAVREKNFLDNNLLIVPSMGSLSKFVDTVKFKICQASGGNTVEGLEISGKAEAEFHA